MFVVEKENEHCKHDKASSENASGLTNKRRFSSEKSHHAENHGEKQKRDGPKDHGGNVFL
jgi:hypothetical protein